MPERASCEVIKGADRLRLRALSRSRSRSALIALPAGRCEIVGGSAPANSKRIRPGLCEKKKAGRCSPSRSV
ncbi:hypothetical protein RR48_02760 [Papilio machaon]|uniref:Uncharacterized protein n=1 Tax=Papilio machaon TaxID=76193 RepID=A0A0N1I9M6_PAPMA|nr:hypothetical protein RR48_02760 [Papilio machaon]